MTPLQGVRLMSGFLALIIAGVIVFTADYLSPKKNDQHRIRPGR